MIVIYNVLSIGPFIMSGVRKIYKSEHRRFCSKSFMESLMLYKIKVFTVNLVQSQKGPSDKLQKCRYRLVHEFY